MKIKKKKNNINGLILSDLESQLFSKGFTSIVGIDEVGRGCMAGPMVVGGFLYNIREPIVNRVNDSKIVSKPLRKQLAINLSQFGNKIIEIPAIDIDKYGLTETFKHAVENIYKYFYNKNTFFLVDGNIKFPDLSNIQSIINGDAKIYSIAASSIIAKVYRDNLMINLSIKYPEYGFDKHVGYCTKAHIQAVNKYGILDGIHRKSYGPVKKIMANKEIRISN